MKPRWLPPVLLGIVAVVVAGTTLVLGRTPTSQPIAFNHRVHVEELEMACVDCHLHVLSGPRATIPNLPVCADCHEEAVTESAAEALLVESLQRGEPIAWFRVTALPNDVYFSHRRHTAMAEIACETCHGEVGSRAQPLTRPLVRPTMNGCIDCHDERGVTSDCVSCHR